MSVFEKLSTFRILLANRHESKVSTRRMRAPPVSAPRIGPGSTSGSAGVFNMAASDAKRLMEATRHEHERLFAAAYDTHDFALDRGLVAQEEDREPSPSVREREVLLWTIEGKTAEEVAMMLCLSVFTVNRHASNAARKLGCQSKYPAAVRALRAGLIQDCDHPPLALRRAGLAFARRPARWSAHRMVVADEPAPTSPIRLFGLEATCCYPG